MASIQIDIKDGLSSSVAIKGPCRVATTANITLVGEQTIDGVAVVTDDRVLVKDQTTASDNGIWIADTGNWRRSKDFNKTKDVKTGTLINVTSGTGAGVWELTTADPISVGSTNLVFAQSILTSLDVIDEDNMASNSATKVPTQQSVKAYVDVLGIPALAGAADVDKRLIVNAAGTGFDKVYIGNIGYPSRFGTYDRTGVADSYAAINSALSSYKYVELGEGTFNLGGTVLYPASYRRLIGVGKQKTILRPSTTNLPGVSIPDGLTGCELFGVTIDRNAVAIAGGDGVITGQTNLTNIRDIETINNWVGLNLGPLGFGQIDDYFIHDSYSHGILIQNNASIGTCQWYINNGLIQANNGWALIVNALNIGPSAVLLGDWDGVKTYANTLGGLALIGLAAIPINGLRLKNSFIGGDGVGGEVYLDTYGTYHRIDATFLEQAARGATGRGLATAAAASGNGLTVTANNIDFNGIGLSLDGNKTHGASLNATTMNKLIGGDIQNNGGYGVVVADGNKTRVIGAQFNNNTSGNTNILSNATGFRAEGCFPDTVNTNGQRTGTATNDSASSGNVGEYIETVVATGSAVALTTGTPANVASIALTAGDWWVATGIEFKGGATTTVTYLAGSTSLTSATLDQTNGRYFGQPFAGAAVFNNTPNGIAGFGVAPVRVSLAAGASVYAVAQAAFATSTCSAFGSIRAWRAR